MIYFCIYNNIIKYNNMAFWVFAIFILFICFSLGHFFLPAIITIIVTLIEQYLKDKKEW